MLTATIPENIKPVFDDLIDTMAGYGFVYEDDPSKRIEQGMQLIFSKEEATYTLTLLDSAHDLWPLFADGFIARPIVDKIIMEFERENQACQIDAGWLDDFR